MQWLRVVFYHSKVVKKVEFWKVKKKIISDLYRLQHKRPFRGWSTFWKKSISNLWHVYTSARTAFLTFWKVMILASHLGQLFRGDSPSPKSPKNAKSQHCASLWHFLPWESPFRWQAVAVAAPPGCRCVSRSRKQTCEASLHVWQKTKLRTQ